METTDIEIIPEIKSVNKVNEEYLNNIYDQTVAAINEYERGTDVLNKLSPALSELSRQIDKQKIKANLVRTQMEALVNKM